MKALCPICNIEGFLQVRGRNAMIQHYIGFKNGKRIYQYHKVHSDYSQVNMQVTASKSPASNEGVLELQRSERVREGGI